MEGSGPLLGGGLPCQPLRLGRMGKYTGAGSLDVCVAGGWVTAVEVQGQPLPSSSTPCVTGTQCGGVSGLTPRQQPVWEWETGSEGSLHMGFAGGGGGGLLPHLFDVSGPYWRRLPGWNLGSSPAFSAGAGLPSCLLPWSQSHHCAGCMLVLLNSMVP